MLADRVKCATATTGTGTVTLGNAVTGFRTFTAAYPASAPVQYVIEDGTAWETGRGTFDRAAGTVTRGPIASSTSGAAINLSGSATIGVVFLSTDYPGDWPALVVNRATAGNGSFQSINNNFTTVMVNSVDLDTHGGWSAANYWYTIQQSGTYDCQGKIRFIDGCTPNVSYGLGLDTSNTDGPAFKWDVTFSAAAANAARQGGYNSRLVKLNAGDQFRLFAYCDNAANGFAAIPVNAAELGSVGIHRELMTAAAR